MINTEKIKKLLNSYKSLKSSVEIELNSKYPAYSLNSISFVKIEGETNRIQSVVENYVVNKYEIPEWLIEQIQIVQIIKLAYESLPEKQRKIVEQRFFEGKTLQDTGQEVELHRKTVSRKIYETILPDLEDVGILKAWELFAKEAKHAEI